MTGGAAERCVRDVRVLPRAYATRRPRRRVELGEETRHLLRPRWSCQQRLKGVQIHSGLRIPPSSVLTQMKPSVQSQADTISLIAVGLGNPGRQYAATRHNAGSMLLEQLVQLGDFGSWHRSEGALVASGKLGGAGVVLVRPLACMNVSGGCVARIARKFGLSPASILVCHDDLDLRIGKLKLKCGGSASGHRGVLSCEESLCTKEFWRLRIGIGRPACRDDVPDFVLETFSECECEGSPLIPLHPSPLYLTSLAHPIPIPTDPISPRRILSFPPPSMLSHLGARQRELSPIFEAAARHFSRLMDDAQLSTASCSNFLNALSRPAVTARTRDGPTVASAEPKPPVADGHTAGRGGDGGASQSDDDGQVSAGPSDPSSGDAQPCAQPRAEVLLSVAGGDEHGTSVDAATDPSPPILTRTGVSEAFTAAVSTRGLLGLANAEQDDVDDHTHGLAPKRSRTG